MRFVLLDCGGPSRALITDFFHQFHFVSYLVVVSMQNL